MLHSEVYLLQITSILLSQSQAFCIYCIERCSENLKRFRMMYSIYGLLVRSLCVNSDPIKVHV